MTDIARRQWRPGDPCRLVNLREGIVHDDAVIDTVKGNKVTVVGGGRRYFVQLPSSFLQERPK